MTFDTFGDRYEIFLPLIDLLKSRFDIVAAFASVDDQAGQILVDYPGITL